MLHSNAAYTFILNSTSQYPIILYFIVLLYANVWARFSPLFLFFCLVKLFFFVLFVRISTIMVNKDEYINSACSLCWRSNSA